ncbi:MAG: hypothetical protein R2705_01000 [Ilumatobacteraceae bacterium]
MQSAKERIEHLRGPGSKWSTVVSDRIGDLSTTVNYNFRGAMRTISRSMDERIEVLTKGNEWDELSRYLQTVVAEQVTEVFIGLERVQPRRSEPRWSNSRRGEPPTRRSHGVGHRRRARRDVARQVARRRR